MTPHPTSDEAKAARRAEIQIAAAREARHKHLTDLAHRYGVELPVMRVGDDHAVDHALALLEAAGAPIDWARIDIQPRKAQP
jgi:hypothetical protein